MVTIITSNSIPIQRIRYRLTVTVSANLRRLGLRYYMYIVSTKTDVSVNGVVLVTASKLGQGSA